MANKIIWEAAWVSRGTVLTTQLNGLADTAFSAVGTEIDNTANLDQYAALDISLATLNPTTGAFLTLFMVQSLDGTNYEDPPVATNPGSHSIVATIPLTTGAGVKRAMSPTFQIPPGKFKFVLKNDANVALNAAGNIVTLYTSNDEVQ